MTHFTLFSVETSEAQRQAEINSALWKACDILRGTGNLSRYRNHILVFLSVKYLSDLWNDRRAGYGSRHADDQALIVGMTDWERFVMPECSRFEYFMEHRADPDIGAIINKGLETLEMANSAKPEGVFRAVDFNSEADLGETRERSWRLRLLIEAFANPVLDFRPSVTGAHDYVGNAATYLIEKFAAAAGKEGGEFFTPTEVSRLLAELLDPQPGMRICDPAIGSGSLAIAVAERASRGTRVQPGAAIYGQESNIATWMLCRMNMLLHGMMNARIELGDTLTDPKLLERDALMRFDIVVASPPFSLNSWGAETAARDRFGRYHRGLPSRSKADFAFISHMVETAAEGHGRVGVVVPLGVLFRGAAEWSIRRALIEENLLDAVIGLPPALFYGTGIPAAILLFNKGRQTRDVLFIDASGECEEVKRRNRLRPEDIAKIAGVFRDRAELDGYSRRASLEEIRGNDYNLSIPHYVNAFQKEQRVDLATVQWEMEMLESELAAVREKLKGYLNELGVARPGSATRREHDDLPRREAV